MVGSHSQERNGMPQYDPCSRNPACVCFHIANVPDTGICTHKYALSCAELSPCNTQNNTCNQLGYSCVLHPKCSTIPVCYPVPHYNERFCLPIAAKPTTTTLTTATTTTGAVVQQPVVPDIPANATWVQDGVTIVGSNETGSNTTQINKPYTLVVDDHETVIVPDRDNDCIIQWKKGAEEGEIVAGGNGPGKEMHQLKQPSDVVVDRKTNSLLIADFGNNRITRWSRLNGTIKGEIFANFTLGSSIAIYDQNTLYLLLMQSQMVVLCGSNQYNDIVAGDPREPASSTNAFSMANFIFVDRRQNLYVSDRGNHRVLRFSKNSFKGVVVAGNQGQGNNLTQLNNPEGLFVDTLDTVYVVDRGNNRVMRWTKGATQGTIILGGKGQGSGAHQFNDPHGLAFDAHGNLYVADTENNRIQRFSRQQYF